MRFSEVRAHHDTDKGYCVIAWNVIDKEWVQISRWYTTYNQMYRYFIAPRKLPISAKSKI